MPFTVSPSVKQRTVVLCPGWRPNTIAGDPLCGAVYAFVGRLMVPVEGADRASAASARATAPTAAAMDRAAATAKVRMTGVLSSSPAGGSDADPERFRCPSRVLATASAGRPPTGGGRG